MEVNLMEVLEFIIKLIKGSFQVIIINFMVILELLVILMILMIKYLGVVYHKIVKMI
jgi:hypothetical protein